MRYILGSTSWLLNQINQSEVSGINILKTLLKWFCRTTGLRSQCNITQGHMEVSFTSQSQGKLGFCETDMVCSSAQCAPITNQVSLFTLGTNQFRFAHPNVVVILVFLQPFYIKFDFSLEFYFSFFVHFFHFEIEKHKNMYNCKLSQIL